MATMTIRDLDDGLKQKLRVQAARNSRSMEEEARAILKSALAHDGAPGRSLYKSIRARIEALGGVDLEIPAREPIRPVDLE